MNTYDIQATVGSNIMLRLSATDQNGTALNLNGFSVRGQARFAYSSSGILLDLNPKIYSAISGLVDITISGSQTVGFPCCVCPYDLEATISGAPNESVVKFLKGFIYFDPETTR
jgi:hypothetical protein